MSLLRIFLTILLTTTMLLLGDGFSLGDLERIEFRGFQTNGVSLTKQNEASAEEVAWRIRGESAVIQKPNYTLNDFQMILDGVDNHFGHYLLESPNCIYNEEDQQARGNSAVTLHGPDGLSASGIGYDFYWNSEQNEGIRLVLRDAVHIELEIGSFQKWKTPAQKTLEDTP